MKCKCSSNKILVFLLIALFTNVIAKNKTIKIKNINLHLEDFKQSMVTIISRTDSPFISEIEEITQSTGFIVNSEKLLILTTKKSARMSPSSIKVQFYDGKIANAKVIYHGKSYFILDVRLPFGIIQVKKGSLKSETRSKYRNLKLGSVNNHQFALNSPVLLIGLNDKGEYVIKNGKILSTNRNLSTRYGSIFQDLGSLKGCPVWNQEGDGKFKNNEVIGMHVIGNNKVSYELKIDYIKPVLEALIKDQEVVIGDIGIDIDLISLSIAEKNFKLNDLNFESQLFKTGKNPDVLMVSNVIESSPAYGKLLSGDIILKINNIIIENDLLLLDNILNKNVGAIVSVEVSRNGEKFKYSIYVENIDKFKIKEYLTFNGAIFHNMNLYSKWYLNTNINGIYLSTLSQGSAFDSVTTKNKNNKSNFLLTRINAKEINSIDNMIEFLKENCDNKSFYVEGIDFNLFSGKRTSSSVDLNPSDFFAYLNTFCQRKKVWERKIIDLSKNCYTKGNKPIHIHKFEKHDIKPSLVKKNKTKLIKSKPPQKNKTKLIKPKPPQKNKTKLIKPKPPQINKTIDQIIDPIDFNEDDETLFKNDIKGNEDSLGNEFNEKDKKKRIEISLNVGKNIVTNIDTKSENLKIVNKNQKFSNQTLSLRFKQFNDKKIIINREIRSKKLFDHLSILHLFM